MPGKYNDIHCDFGGDGNKMPEKTVGTKMFQDDNGNESSMRVMCFIVIVFCVCMASYVLAIWGYISISTMQLQRLDFVGLGSVLGAVGGLMTKALQKKFEQRDYRGPINPETEDTEPKRSPPREL